MKRVLLVEDHSSFRRALAFVLEREPDLRVVAQAGSLAEARSRVNGESEFDVAVLDLGLPDGNGMDLISELRKANPDASIVVLTVDLNPKNQDLALEKGADAVLGKEASITQIVAAVRNLQA
ncbi:MAG TPA: response regulator transcription factor [Rubrobacteraceae bacterium]|nr:response regulator transcription factor [Rubrobacteraceae bacterium]